MSYTEIKGDLIELAKQGKFDVIAHGCNCFCTMGAGIAPVMAKAFGCDKFQLELLKEYRYDEESGEEYVVKTNNKGDINKLGCIDYEHRYLWFKHPMLKDGETSIAMNHKTETVGQENVKDLYVVNAYTQYRYSHKFGLPVDYEAITLCMRKINHVFKGKHIGLPMIGAGLAGGDWERIKTIIQTELKECEVTIVIYDKK